MRGFMGAAASAAALHAWPGSIRRAFAAPGDPVFPTIFIHLRGGLDPIMHWDARTGFVNRDVTAAKITTTPAGVKWNTDTMTPLAAHMNDAVVIRGITFAGGHPAGEGNLWFGAGALADARNATPWANYLASELLKNQKVAAPAVTSYFESGDEITNYVTLNNKSPDPQGAAQRVRSALNFGQSLDLTAGLPSPEAQTRIYQHIANMDARTHSPTVQSRTTSGFDAANIQADQLLAQPPPIFWPPDAATTTGFNLSAGEINATTSGFKALTAMAYQLARYQLSHVVFVEHNGAGYDTHSNHIAGQKNASNLTMPAIGRLLTQLKATPSPVPGFAGSSMFDTTHVVVTTELMRANSAQGGVDQNGNPFDGSGTPHWPWTQVMAFGGRFKRGYSMGDVGADFKGLPVDPNTGALNQGSVLTWNNVLATILEANKVNVTGYTSAAPLRAVLGA